MRELERPIDQVWRRMRFQRFLAALVWCWGVALTFVAVAIAVEKFWDRPLPGPDWWPFALAGGLGMIVAAVIALAGGPSRVDAAVAIDHAFHLDERLSTALTLPAALRETPAGRALLADASRHIAALDVRAAFGPTLPRRVWVPLIPAALAVALLFVPAEWVQQSAQARSTETIAKRVVIDQTRALSRRIADQRKGLDKSRFAEADKILADIEKAADALAKSPPTRKDKALVALNRLTDAIKGRQKQIGSPEQIHRRLQQLKDMAGSGPADELARDIARGDFQKAANELERLREKLTSGQMTEAEQKALRQQLAEMAKQLERLARLDERRKQLETARNNGGLSREQFDQEMAKLDEQAKGLGQVRQLASKLGQAQQQLGQGDLQKAAEALGLSRQQLDEMARQLQELESLDGALADLQDAKDGMTGGDWNQLGERPGFGMDPRGGPDQGRGQGLGRGKGQGDRPEAPDQTATYNTKVQQQFRKGKAVLEGFSRSNKPVKGQSLIDIQGELATSEGVSAEALTNQKVPKHVEKHIRGYFDQINRGR